MVFVPTLWIAAFYGGCCAYYFWKYFNLCLILCLLCLESFSLVILFLLIARYLWNAFNLHWNNAFLFMVITLIYRIYYWVVPNQLQSHTERFVCISASESIHQEQDMQHTWVMLMWMKRIHSALYFVKILQGMQPAEPKDLGKSLSKPIQQQGRFNSMYTSFLLMLLNIGFRWPIKIEKQRICWSDGNGPSWKIRKIMSNRPSPLGHSIDLIRSIENLKLAICSTARANKVPSILVQDVALGVEQHIRCTYWTNATATDAHTTQENSNALNLRNFTVQ